jgi:hypothetical protein
VARQEHTLLGAATAKQAKRRRGQRAEYTLLDSGEIESLSSPLFSSSPTFSRPKETELTPYGRARDTVLGKTASLVGGRARYNVLDEIALARGPFPREESGRTNCWN